LRFAHFPFGIQNESMSSSPPPNRSYRRDKRAPGKPLPIRIIAAIPGLALLFAVGFGGKWIEAAIKRYGAEHHQALPNIEYVLWAILIGVVIGNTVGGARWFRVFLPGIETYEFWLKLGIVLLGVRFLLRDVVKLGGLSLGLVAIEIILSIAMMILIGRLFKLTPKLTALLAVGSSVCGVSAIIATQGAIDADEKETSYAIAAILALGAISLFTYPVISRSLGMTDQAYGVWAGLSVDNTAEATAAGALRSETAKDIAVLVKTTRNAMIGFVVLGAALYFAGRGGSHVEGSKALFVWHAFPKFVLGFLLFSGVASLTGTSWALLDAAQIKSLENLSRWAFLLTFAGVGLRTNFRELGHQGWRPLIVGAVGEIFIAVLTLGLVIGADALFGLSFSL
jgi:uncharacterized integral membrane protein (TIGR00698 family)